MRGGHAVSGSGHQAAKSGVGPQSSHGSARYVLAAQPHDDSAADEGLGQAELKYHEYEF